MWGLMVEACVIKLFALMETYTYILLFNSSVYDCQSLTKGKQEDDEISFSFNNSDVDSYNNQLILHTYIHTYYAND